MGVWGWDIGEEEDLRSRDTVSSPAAVAAAKAPYLTRKARAKGVVVRSLMTVEV